MALLSPNGSVPPGKKSVVLTVYNVFCCLSGSTGIFFPEILPVKKNRRTPFQNTVIDTSVGQVRRVFEFGQLQVGGDDHGPAAAVAAVNDEKHLLHRILGAALHTQIVNDKQVVLVKVGDKVNVMIKDIQDTKIALTLKLEENNPWKNAAEKYQIGTVVTLSLIHI